MTPPRPLAIALALATAWASSACSSLPPIVGEPAAHVDDANEEQHYKEIFDRWTRRAQVYDKLDQELFVAATLESPEFRTARIQRMGSFKSMPPDAVKAAIDQELGSSQQTYDFFMAVIPGARSWDDFDRPNSIWRLALVTSTGEVTPLQIDRIGKADVNLRGVYLYLGDFWTAYRIHFPVTFPSGRPVITPEDHQVTLRISSAKAHTELVFDAAPVGATSLPHAATFPTY
jgi:hypothetical protein